jgi:hypothetical protein
VPSGGHGGISSSLTYVCMYVIKDFTKGDEENREISSENKL